MLNRLFKQFRLRVTGICVDNIDVRKQVMSSKRYRGIESVPTIIITFQGGFSNVYTENDAISKIIELGRLKNVGEAEQRIKHEKLLLKSVKLPPSEPEETYTYAAPNNQLLTATRPLSTLQNPGVASTTVNINGIIQQHQDMEEITSVPDLPVSVPFSPVSPPTMLKIGSLPIENNIPTAHLSPGTAMPWVDNDAPEDGIITSDFEALPLS